MASNDDLATFSLLVNGSEFTKFYDVVSISIVKELYRITTARIVIRDGSPASADFPVSDSDSFVPGTPIEIQAGFNSNNSTVFKGIVTYHAVQCVTSGGPELIIEAKDSAVKMTIARNNAYFIKKKDSDIITSLIGNYSGLSNDVDSTSYEWPELIQYYSTDWDFMLTRAEANGMFVATDQNKVSVKAFKAGSSVATFTYGLDIYAFSAGMDARRELSGATAQGWDYKTQAMVTATGAEPSPPSQGNLTGTTLSSATAPSAFVLSTTSPLEQAPLQSWADAQMIRSRYAKIKGTIRILGNSTIALGNVITLAGMGSRFNGDAFVAGINHQLSEGQWYTTVEIGIDDNWFAERLNVTTPAAAGLLPGVRGLLNATVKAISSDPDNETRIQINIPVISPDGDGVWARMGNQYATNGAGFYWIPEVGDEVIVGFLNEDPTYPIILGSLYSTNLAPPYTPDSKNTYKAIYSKSKIYLEFDDENKNLTITTPGKNQVIFSDQNQNITIKDQNNNQIVMSSSGIQMKSPNDIELNATGSVKITGTAGVNITSSADMSVQASTSLTAKGLSVSISADTEMTVKGGATAEYSSGGETTVKGSIVMIN